MNIPKIILLFLCFCLTTTTALAKNMDRSCVANFIVKGNACMDISAGEITGDMTDRSFHPLPLGGKWCYNGPSTIEYVSQDSLKVYLCGGLAYVFSQEKYPECYKTIQPGQTLMVSGMISGDAHGKVLKAKCTIINEN